MFRCLISNFQRSLSLTQKVTSEISPQLTKSFLCPFTTLTNPTPTEPPSGQLDSDEYIVPYRADRESRRKNNNLILDMLRNKFRLSEHDVQKVLSDEAVHRSYKENFLSRSLELLCSHKITKNTFLECPWLITMEPKRLELKLKDLKSLDIRDINEFAPLLRLTNSRLNKLLLSLRREGPHIPQGNRVYYISEQLNMSPFLVTKYLSKRLFILEMPFDMLKLNLEHMLHYNVPALNILRDLWAFRYSPQSVEKRLERAKLAKKDKIMPWMVRCPENILQRSFQLSMEEKEILGDKNSVVDYVAERLGFTVSETQAIMSKHPLVFKVRAPKIKEVLDYLLDEEHFTRHEIAQNPRILCHSLKTTKERINELKSFGCRPSSLVIVCRSKREYEKFLNSWKEIRDRIEENTSKSND